MPYTISEPFPGVFHMLDPMGVCVTLLVGQKRALLFDTGYGLLDLPKCIKKITRLPLTVVCSHGHHDHALGSLAFDEVYLSAADLSIASHYLRTEKREMVLAQAQLKGLLPPGFDREAYKAQPIKSLRALDFMEDDLGDFPIEIIPMPGHTPGSIGLFARKQSLLLTGDSWNPITWVFLRESLPLMEYASTMRKIAKLPFAHVLGAHHRAVFKGQRLISYIDGLFSRDTLSSAVPSPIAPFDFADIYVCKPEPGSKLFFDKNKTK